MPWRSLPGASVINCWWPTIRISVAICYNRIRHNQFQFGSKSGRNAFANKKLRNSGLRKHQWQSVSLAVKEPQGEREKPGASRYNLTFT